MIKFLSKGGTNTSDATVTAGDIIEGAIAYGANGQLTGTMPNNGALSYNPSTSQQSIPEGYTSGGTIGAVDNTIDANITPGNIKSGSTILGVTGNVVELVGQEKEIYTESTLPQEVTPDIGYNGLTKVTTDIPITRDNYNESLLVTNNILANNAIVAKTLLVQNSTVQQTTLVTTGTVTNGVWEVE